MNKITHINGKRIEDITRDELVEEFTQLSAVRFNENESNTEHIDTLIKNVKSKEKENKILFFMDCVLTFLLVLNVIADYFRIFGC
jgi:hypothetical protein